MKSGERHIFVSEIAMAQSRMRAAGKRCFFAKFQNPPRETISSVRTRRL